KFMDAESRYKKIQTAAALIDMQLERERELKLNAGSSDQTPGGLGLKLDLESLVMAMRTQQVIGSPNGEAKLLNSLGVVYNRLGKSKEALEKLNRAILIFRSAGDLSGEATASANAMIAWRALGNHRMA